MTSRNLALFLALAGALVGCGGSDGGGGGGGGGGGDGGGGGGDTYFYVVSSATLGAISGDSAPGFNLDASDANVCGDETTVVDYASQAPETGDGVDNQLLELAESLKDVDFGGDEPFTLDLDTFLKEAVLEGKFTLLLEVSGVDDLDNDNDVKVSAYLGDLVGGGAPASAGGKLTAGQDFEVATTIKTNAAGTITNGRLSISLDSLDVVVPVETYDTTLTLTVNDVRLKFDISATELTSGVLGGSLDVDATVEEIKTFLTAAEFDINADTLIKPILEERADLDETGGECAAVSAAIVFTGVEANKN
jgi:hypothetical protein